MIKNRGGGPGGWLLVWKVKDATRLQFKGPKFTGSGCYCDDDVPTPEGDTWPSCEKINVLRVPALVHASPRDLDHGIRRAPSPAMRRACVPLPATAVPRTRVTGSVKRGQWRANGQGYGALGWDFGDIPTFGGCPSTQGRDRPALFYSIG